jgi:phosphate transport system protein
MPRKSFHKELESIKRDVLKMGDLAKHMLQRSIESLVRQDRNIADSVLDRKRELADMDENIEHRCLRVISLQQPMAKDMRTIATCLKLITYIMRIGRYGKDIAVMSKELSNAPHIAKLVSIPYMSQITCGMITDALKAFKTGDLSLLEDFSERDDSVDALRYSIFRECVTYMIEDPKKITRCSHYILIAKYLERCADHACKMAEKIHYMITGKRVEIK